MALNRHIDDELLERYAMHTASAGECDAVEEHLMFCAECRERLNVTDMYLHAMRSASAQLRREAESQGWAARLFGGTRLAWALGVALALLLLAGVRWQWPRGGGSHPPVTVALLATRGETGAAPVAPPGRPLRLVLNVTGLPPLEGCRVEVITAGGERVFEGAAALRRDGAELQIPARRAGLYFVRLYTQPASLVREYSLLVGGR